MQSSDKAAEPQIEENKIEERKVEEKEPEKEPDQSASHFRAEITDNDGKKTVIVFDERLKEFDSIFKTTEFEHLDFKLIKEPHLVKKVQEFFRKHNYDKASIAIKRPMVSNKFQENVDGVTFEVLKGSDQLSSDYEKQENEEDAVKLIQIAEYLAIPEFKNAIYSAVSSKFFIGSTEEDLEKFREQHNLHELSVSEQEAIIKEYSETFGKLQKRFQAELIKLEAELPNN